MRYLPALALIVIGGPASADFAGKVVAVSDGDTVTVLTEDETQVRVRLYGIDAPESGQDFGARAKQAASDLAFGQAVTVRTTRVDRFGRTVGEVVLADGRSVNRELVRQGMAWHYAQVAPKDEDMARLQAEAKRARRGLWSQPDPVAPWAWRSGSGLPADAGVVGNRNSLIFHAPNCRSVGRTKEENRVGFETVAEAEKAGFRAAGDCRIR